ncbi:Cell cycle serine/threonine-protein kinase cdc5/MSD2 [Rhodotorula mucilaginosa]|uniref:Cell cycle serine/threonine-protein kinase cdc5/MSD2 n=1 Tax=Rhodotorula mucilaginosa TaxID=5537 RepID=A0A9P6WAI8_RHOMI|nr:Cell cycle serine/threonine-protein kinase cdc5/MSD2 [Rhodotorula mucilaginosa]
MLVQPRHPDSVPSRSSHSSTRPGLPLARSSSTAAAAATHMASARQPLGAIQPLVPTRSGSGALAAQQQQHQEVQKLQQQTRRSTSPPEPRPSAPPQAPPPAQAQKDKEKEKARSKLSEQWADPPKRVRREDVWLDRRHLLGEGGFARVYLCIEPDGVSHKALKVIDKQQLKSTKTKSKLFAEIKIHQAMSHPNIIAFEHCFEDDGNVYMQLELCANGSMLDVLRARKRYSEPEARFYLTQLVGACDYMHANSVIHRDLKLGNLMLDQNMNLRVGDFGLAALVKTICGTPNYIAPEILFDQQGGHSFEVDIWSIGVILYTLLIGRPPFQTKDVKAIYKKIRDNSYAFPEDHSLSVEAVDLISWILRPNPTDRPTLSEILAHPWFVTGPFPSRISTRALDPERAVGLGEEWSRMSKRHAWDNFRKVKRAAGVVEVEGTGVGPAAPTVSQQQQSQQQEQTHVPQMVSQALPIVAEAVEEDAAAAAAGVTLADPVRGGHATSSIPATRPVDALESMPGALPLQSGIKRSKSTMRIVRAEEEKDAKGRVEKEVRSATAPESPISELLRSARKPLLVSPASRGGIRSQSASRQVSSAGGSLQQRLQAAAISGSSSSSGSAGSTAAVPPSSSAGPAVVGQPEFERPRTVSGGSSKSGGSVAARHGGDTLPKSSSGDSGTNAPRPRHRRTVAPTAAAATTTTTASDPAPAPPLPPSATPKTTVHPSRSLYEATWRTFDAFLACRATADVAAVSASVVDSLPSEEAQHAPRVFITSWVDYTHKYGTAYSLTDGTAGLYFNDSTTMVLSPDKEHFDYISNRKDNVYTRRHYSLSVKPTELDRKAYLLQYFEDYMAKTLRRDVAWLFEDVQRKKNMDFLVKYYRMKQAIVFKMSNDVLQFNFYDHYKLIITSSGLVVTVIDRNFTQTTYTLPALFRLAASHGHYAPRHAASDELKQIRILLDKVGYCRDVLRTLVNRKTSSSSTVATASAATR